MKQLYVALVAPLMVVSMLTAQEKELIILHTSGSHGRIFPIQVTDQNATSQMADEGAKAKIEPARKGEIGGMSALAAAVNDIRRKLNSQNVLLVDGGDSLKDVVNTVGGLIQTAGMEWNVDLNKPAGERISNVNINGEAINPDTWYQIATHAGMLKGLHGYEELEKGRAIEKTEEAIVLLVEENFKEKIEVSASEVNISVKN